MRRAAPARVREQHAELGAGGVDAVRKRGPAAVDGRRPRCGRPVEGVQRRGIGRDTAGVRDRHRAGEHEPGAAARQLRQQVGLGGGADDAVAQPLPRREQRRRSDGARAAAVEPRVEHAHELRVALREVRVRHPPAARQQVERERHRLHVRVALHAREVRGALAGGELEALDDRLALELVVDQSPLDVGRMAGERLRERDRVLHRELRAGTDREVRRVRGVAEQRDVAVVPAVAADEHEAGPQRAVAEQPVAAELVGEQRLAERERLRLVHRVEPERAPGVLRALDDPRARALVERIRVDLDEAGVGLLEDERERVEHEVRAEPGELAALRLDARPERIGVRAPHEAVDAVGADDEVGVRGDLRDVRHLRPEAEAHAELARPLLQDLEQQLARDRGERVTARAQQPAAVADVDRRPARERVGDPQVGLGVGVAQRAERLLREHDAPAERRVGRVALEHLDVVPGAGLRQHDRELQPGGSGPDDPDLHASASASRSSCAGSATAGNRISSSQPASA